MGAAFATIGPASSPTASNASFRFGLRMAESLPVHFF
jgi:hypothetical protein